MGPCQCHSGSSVLGTASLVSDASMALWESTARYKGPSLAQASPVNCCVLVVWNCEWRDMGIQVGHLDKDAV